MVFLSGLLLLSFRKLIAVDLGFARKNVALFDLARRDPMNRNEVSGAELLERLRELPAIENQALVDSLLKGTDHVGQQFEKLGDDPDPVPQQIVGSRKHPLQQSKGVRGTNHIVVARHRRHAARLSNR